MRRIPRISFSARGAPPLPPGPTARLAEARGSERRSDDHVAMVRRLPRSEPRTSPMKLDDRPFRQRERGRGVRSDDRFVSGSGSAGTRNAQTCAVEFPPDLNRASLPAVADSPRRTHQCRDLNPPHRHVDLLTHRVQGNRGRSSGIGRAGLGQRVPNRGPGLLPPANCKPLAGRPCRRSTMAVGGWRSGRRLHVRSAHPGGQSPARRLPASATPHIGVLVTTRDGAEW